MPPELALVRPCIDYAGSFREMAEEFHASGERRYDRDLPLIREHFDAYLRKLDRTARGIDLPADSVPQEEYWLVDRETGAVLGAIRIRLAITPRLEQIDGQIGYNVRPSARCKGCGSRMLAMALDLLRKRGWKRVLITCNADNLASARVIEKNGGVLENRVIEEETGKLISRYWITLSEEDLAEGGIYD